MEPMIKLENIHQEFDGETILDNINLNIYSPPHITCSILPKFKYL